MRRSIPLSLVFIGLLATACPGKSDATADNSSSALEIAGTTPAQESTIATPWLDRIPEADRKKSAPALNEAGFAEYNKKDYDRAALYFGAATERDSALAVAHYNLACALSLLYGEKKYADLDMIVRHLHLTWRLDPAYRKKMKNDADLNPIRTAPAYRQWVAQLDKPEFAILSARFPTAYFQYCAPFMYRPEAAVLAHVEQDGKTGFIPLDRVSMVKMPEFDAALVYNVYFADEAALRELRTKSKDDEQSIAPFGEIPIAGMANSVFIMFYNMLDKRVVAEREETGWRVSIGLGAGLGNVRPVEGWDAIQGTNSEFSSGWYTQLRVYARSGNRVLASEPITIESEDLSGGQARRPGIDYKNARQEGATIVIDKFENDRFSETVTLIDLNQ